LTATPQAQGEEVPQTVSPRFWRGDWVDFVGLLMIVVGSLDFFQGLIAVVRNQYYTLDPNEIIVVNLTAWGWIMLFWGSLVALSGAALWFRQSAARWVAIVVMVLNLVVELGFAGYHNYPLWAVMSNAITILVIYGLIVHWDGANAVANETGRAR
jgi:hypothetical protein